jgi:DNA mismatch endonuclease (patch repair protein)
VPPDGVQAPGETSHTCGVTDFLSPETRSRVMSRIRAKDTQPELALRRALHAAGCRGWRCHPKKVPGRPDVAFTRRRVAVFVDGRFWHGHPDYFTFGKSGEYWDRKIARTQERDRLANEALREKGWTVLRFWDFEVEEDLATCVDRVLAALHSAAAVPRATDPAVRRSCAAAD